jgi:hypothetical protein
LTRETQYSSDFVDRTIREFGPRIWIQKQLDPLRRGTPDIYSMVEGNFIPIESKRVNQESGNKILSHNFTKMQVKRMKDLLITGAYPIGMIFYDDEIRYILPLDIREDGQISMEEYKKLPLFNWEEIIHVATETHRNRYNRR